MIDIKDIQGNVVYSTPINVGSKRKYTLMQEDYITLMFSTDEPLEFELGVGVDNEIGLFELVTPYKPKYNNNTGGYDYELRLDAYYYKWKNKIFKFTPEVGGQEASWSLTASLDVHLGIFLRNLQALGYTYRGTEFEFSIDATVENKAIGMTYENMNMIDALSAMAESWDCEWWITDNIIHFGRCEYGDAVDFIIGENVAEMTRSESKSEYATRLYVFGSTRNLPSSYRPTDESVVVNGVVQRRLMLPSGIPYIDAYEGMSQEEAIEEVVILEDVYPKTDGNISSVETYTDSVENEDGTTTEETFYRFKDNGITFSKDYILEGEELRVKFTSGSLNGMEFGLAFNPKGVEEKTDGAWNPEAQLFEVVANEDYGRKLPDSTLNPKVGDTYILIGWDSTKIADLGLVSAAEEQLYQEGLKLSVKRKIDPNTYGCKMFSDYMYGLDDNGNQNPDYAKSFEVGDRVKLINSAYFKDGRQSRIIGYEYSLDIPYDSPTYIVGETSAYSRLGALETKLEALTYAGQTYTGGGGSGVYVIGTNDSTRPTNRNVYSALRTDKSFLRKDQDDRSKGSLGVDKDFDVLGNAEVGGNQTVKGNATINGTATIGSDTTIGGNTTMDKKATAKKGMQFGESFASGILTGHGGHVDEYGNGELESLIIRRFLEVPELRFNRVQVTLGDKWNAAGAGVLERVDPDEGAMTGTAWLKLEDGEYGAIAVGDICMGIFHSEDSSIPNATEDADDSRGNFQFAGFYTCYFTITEITGSDNKEFRYQMRPESDRWKLTYHPSAQMTFVSYGSFSQTDRQTSVYTTRTYTRLLKNQNTWEISAANIAMQYGNMENMSIHGLDMTGYSMYLNNIYMTGKIREVRPDGTPVMVVNDRGEWVSGTTYAYYDRVSYNGSLWLCVNESGTNTTPSKSDASWLLQVEAGVGITSSGQWKTANTPYKANTIVTFAESVWISNKDTSEAPFPIYTDNQGNRLTFNDGGYILVHPLVQSADWDLLLSAPDITKGEDGKSIEVRYSADKTNWHSSFQDGDLYMQQRVGDGAWSNAMRIVGESGADGTDGVYAEFQFAKNTSLTTAPTTGWQDAPPSVGEGEYLWMRQRVVDPNNNTTSSWSVARIKGDVGEGYTTMGQWKTGMSVPKMGVVTMGGSVYVAKVATTNPPLWTYTDNSGNRLLFNDGGYILTGEVNTAEYDLWVEKPLDGKDGKDGINGTNGKDGKDGEQGIQGCIVRDSEWAVGVEYRNDEALTSGTRWLDVALIRDDSAATGWRAYKCKVTHTSTTANAPGNTTYWEEFSANFTAIFTSLIIAKNAKITFLQGNQLLIQEDDGTITAGMSGSNEGSAYRFWAGAETPDDAPFRVNKQGEVTMTKAHVVGEVNATSGKFVGEITAGSLAFKAIVANGSSVSMNGYTFAKGHGIYTLPSPKGFTQVYAFCDWYIRTARDFTMKAPSPNKIVIRNAQYVSGFEYVDEYMMSDRTLYKFTCMPNDTYEYVWVVTKEDMI